MTGRVLGVLIVAALIGDLGIAIAGRTVRDGVAWNAQPELMRQDKAVKLRWTITARSADRSTHALPCMWFNIIAQRGHFDRGKFVLDTEEVRREPGSGSCANDTPRKLERDATWRIELPVGDTNDARPNETVRIRVQARSGDDVVFLLTTVTLAVSADGKPKLTPGTDP